MEIQAVIEHEPLDEWVERESQSAEEMGEEHYPLMGPGGDELPLIGEPVRDVIGQVSGSPQFLDVSLRDGGDHPLASHSGHAWSGLRRKCELGCWSSSAQEWMSKEEEDVGRKRLNLIPL